MKRIQGLPVALFFFLLPVSESAHALTHNVPEDISFVAAIAAAGNGDTISLADGIHQPALEIEITQDNLIIEGRSGDPLVVCVEPPNAGFRVFHSDGTSGVTLKDLCIRGTGLGSTTALIARNCSDWSVENCRISEFVASVATSSAMACVDSDIEIVDCTFTENIGLAGGALVFLDLDGVGNTHAVRRCSFESNSAAIGGGVAILSNGPVGFPDPMTTTVFEIEDSSFRECATLSPTSGYGGAVYVAGGMISPVSGSIIGSTISDCTAVTGGGGIALVRSRGHVTLHVEGSAFNDNVASASAGGAILVTEYPPPGERDQVYRTVLSASMNTFASNTAEIQGGGIAADPGDDFTDVFIFNNHFENNRAKSGGGVCLATIQSEADQFRILDNTFRSNFARSAGAGSGGGLCLVGSKSLVKGNLFRTNAADNGGGVALAGDGSRVTENLFGDGSNIGNDASDGAGLFILFSPLFAGLRPVVTNNLFYDNFCLDHGGGLYATTTFSEAQLFVAGNVFSDNTGSSEILGAAAAFAGPFTNDLVFAHNTLLDHRPAPEKGPPVTTESTVLLRLGAEPLIANNILYNENPQDIAGIREEVASAPSIRSNVFFNLGIPYFDDGTSALTVGDLNDLAGADGNLEVDPELVPGDWPGSRYPNPHLQRDSSLIDAAADIVPFDEDLLADLPRDIDALLRPPGDPRLFGAGFDVGADEVGIEPTPTPTRTPAPPGSRGAVFCFNNLPDAMGRFDEDLPIGQLHTGELIGGATITGVDPDSPDLGFVLCLDATSEFVAVEDPSGELGFPVSATGEAGSFTVSCYVYVDEEVFSQRRMYLCWKGDFVFPTNNYRFSINADGRLELGGGNSFGPDSAHIMETRTWTHVAAHFDGEARTVQYFVDFQPGFLYDYDRMNGMENDEPLYIGSSGPTQFNPGTLRGYMDKFRITIGFDPWLEERIQTPTPTPTKTDTPTETPIETDTPTPTETEEVPDPTETNTPEPIATAEFDCDVVDGNVPALNPRCDCFDLLVLIRNQRGEDTGIRTNFDGADGEDPKDLFLFAVNGWYRAP